MTHRNTQGVNEHNGTPECPRANAKASGYNAISNTRYASWGTGMECKVSWMGQDGMAFAAETGSGHLVTMDGAPEGGGRNLAPRPMEMVLLGTGGCTAYDVVMILKKSRQEIAGCSVTLKAERASEDPKVFTKIHFHFTVTGKNLNPATVERAINLSHDKYCSASIMIAKTAELTHSFDIVAG
jgi:putative redox protein